MTLITAAEFQRYLRWRVGEPFRPEITAALDKALYAFGSDPVFVHDDGSLTSSGERGNADADHAERAQYRAAVDAHHRTELQRIVDRSRAWMGTVETEAAARRAARPAPRLHVFLFHLCRVLVWGRRRT